MTLFCRFSVGGRWAQSLPFNGRRAIFTKNATSHTPNMEGKHVIAIVFRACMDTTQQISVCWLFRSKWRPLPTTVAQFITLTSRVKKVPPYHMPSAIKYRITKCCHHRDFMLGNPLNYTGKLCHRGKCHSGNCHSGERWMSRPFVHSGNLNFKHTLTNDLVFHNAWKRIICHFIT